MCLCFMIEMTQTTGRMGERAPTALERGGRVSVDFVPPTPLPAMSGRSACLPEEAREVCVCVLAGHVLWQALDICSLLHLHSRLVLYIVVTVS